MVSQALDNSKNCLILSHRTELLTQTGGSLEKLGNFAIKIHPKNKRPNLIDGELYLAMAQTLTRRIKKPKYIEWLKKLDLIVIDEAHTSDADFIWKALEEHNPECYVIGATATPKRKGNQRSLHLFYKSMIECVTVDDLIQQGYLSKPTYYTDDEIASGLSKVNKRGGEYDNKEVGDLFTKLKVYSGVIENYEKYCKGQKTLIFSSSIESSEELVEQFKKHGYEARHLDYRATPSEREDTLKWFNDNPKAILSNVGILTAGFDQPDIINIILYRATTSIPLLLQMIGRGSRICEGKNEFNVLDFGTNISRLGFWHADRKWKLRHKHKRGIAPTKDCPGCGAVLPASATICKYCGHEFKSEEEEETPEIKILKKIPYRQIKIKSKNAGREGDFETLEQIAKAKGYKHGWILWQIPDEKLYEYAKYKKYSPYWVSRQMELREQKRKKELIESF